MCGQRNGIFSPHPRPPGTGRCWRLNQPMVSDSADYGHVITHPQKPKTTVFQSFIPGKRFAAPYPRARPQAPRDSCLGLCPIHLFIGGRFLSFIILTFINTLEFWSYSSKLAKEGGGCWNFQSGDSLGPGPGVCSGGWGTML